MLEYFGFYSSLASPNPEPPQPPPTEDEVVARATHLANRCRHSQPIHTGGRAWESTGAPTLKR